MLLRPFYLPFSDPRVTLVTLLGQNIGTCLLDVTPVGPDVMRHQIAILWGNILAEPISAGSAVLSNSLVPVHIGNIIRILESSTMRRNVFMTFSQPQGFNDQTLVSSTSPYWSWNISAFSEAMGLGDSIAGTFMLAEHDP